MSGGGRTGSAESRAGACGKIYERKWLEDMAFVRWAVRLKVKVP